MSDKAEIFTPEVWQTLMVERLWLAFERVSTMLPERLNAHSLAESVKIDLNTITPISNQRRLFFNVIASGLLHPQTYCFEAKKEEPFTFFVRPLDPKFIMGHSTEDGPKMMEQGYVLDDPSAAWIGIIADEILSNYHGDMQGMEMSEPPASETPHMKI